MDSRSLPEWDLSELHEISGALRDIAIREENPTGYVLGLLAARLRALAGDIERGEGLDYGFAEADEIAGALKPLAERIEATPQAYLLGVLSDRLACITLGLAESAAGVAA